MDDFRTKFLRDGFVVLEGFLSPAEVEALRAQGVAFTKDLPPEGERAVFSTTSVQQNKDRYFLDSADKVSLFFEADALGPEGKLQVDAENSLNKVGHNLHQLNPTFQKTTFSNKKLAYIKEQNQPHWNYEENQKRNVNIRKQKKCAQPLHIFF